MTPEEFVARKRTIMLIAGIGIFSLLCSYTVTFVMPNNGRLAILLTAIFLGCIFIAGSMAFKLKKETTPK
jgi:hypothetical protein